jgi:hypothetical protein
MVWHGDMMFAAHPSRHPDVTACLARLLIAQYPESFPEIGA